MTSVYSNDDFSYKKIKEIKDELELVNEIFRDLGFTWTLKKKDLFELPEEVDPPKDSWESEDEAEILSELVLNYKSKDEKYYKHSDRLNAEIIETSFEDSESDSDDSVYEVKKSKEIVELLYLRIEKNF